MGRRFIFVLRPVNRMVYAACRDSKFQWGCTTLERRGGDLAFSMIFVARTIETPALSETLPRWCGQLPLPGKCMNTFLIKRIKTGKFISPSWLKNLTSQGSSQLFRRFNMLVPNLQVLPQVSSERHCKLAFLRPVTTFILVSVRFFAVHYCPVKRPR